MLERLAAQVRPKVSWLVSLSVAVPLLLPLAGCKRGGFWNVSGSGEETAAESGGDVVWSSNASEREREIQEANRALLQHTGKANLGQVWPEGGRSWTRQDEQNFAAWVDSVPVTLLQDWKIPTDCADSVLALRWIYAVKNGLAVKFKLGGRSFDSTSYRSNPVQLLVDAHLAIGADSLLDLAYPVDMTIPNNYRGGLFVSKGYHVYLMRGALKREGTPTFLFKTIESTVPSKIRLLKETIFMLEEPSKDYFKMLRFRPVVNRGGYLEYDMSIAAAEFPEESSLSRDFISRCTDLKQYGPGIGVAPLWVNFINYAKYTHEHPQEISSADKRRQFVEQCRHNIQMMASGRSFYTSLRSQLEQDVCKTLQSRIGAVIEGHNACFGKPASGTCTAEAAGDYSTPNRDKALADKARALRSFSAELTGRSDSSAFQCSAMDLTAGARPMPQGSNAARSVSLKPFSSSGLSGWMGRLENGSGASPVDPLHVRWGCSSNQSDFACLR